MSPIVVSLLAAACLAAPALVATDRQTRTVALPPQRTLSLEITVGDVLIEASPRADASIEIVRHAPTEEGLARIPVSIEETRNEVRVHAVQAEGATTPTVKTDVTLRVPSDARITSLRMVEGRLTVTALTGAIAADVRRGPIVATDVAGTLRLETGMGSISVQRARLSERGLLHLRAFNGDVKLSLEARPPDARILALALNGTITSDIPLAMKERWGPRSGEATLGRGEPVISLESVMGNVELRLTK